MKISKDRFQEMKDKASKALKRARETGQVKNAGEAAAVIGVGLAAGVVSSLGLGAIPMPAAVGDKGALLKDAVQAGGGVFLMLQKNKWMKYAGAGIALLGGADFLRRVLPVAVPTMAGEADDLMYGYGDGRDLSKEELLQLQGGMGARDSMMGARDSMAGASWDAPGWK